MLVPDCRTKKTFSDPSTSCDYNGFCLVNEVAVCKTHNLNLIKIPLGFKIEVLDFCFITKVSWIYMPFNTAPGTF